MGSDPVDAVISDILMPVMDDYRLCHEIRKSGRAVAGVASAWPAHVASSPATAAASGGGPNWVAPPCSFMAVVMKDHGENTDRRRQRAES
jgi:CheY-like chemotaxis protein